MRPPRAATGGCRRPLLLAHGALSILHTVFQTGLFSNLPFRKLRS